MSKKCLDDELYDIYIQDGKQIIECLREIYKKGVADTVDKCIHIIQEIHDKKLYCLEDLCIGDGRTCDECAIDIIKTSLERIKGDTNDTL